MKTAAFLFVVVASASALASATAVTPAVVAVSSNTVALHQPELRPAVEGWRLAGCLALQRGAWPQMTTHLDLVFLDADGSELAVRTEALAASALRERPRRPLPHARYDLVLSELPAGTARIEVRAHDHTNHKH